MKKIIALIPLMVFAFFSKYTPHINYITAPLHCDYVLHKRAFDICYSCEKKEPLAVAYELLKKNLEKHHYSRHSLHFKPDYSLPKICRSYPEDYSHLEYDKGHNAPNGAFNYNRQIQKQTFLMSNISPQAEWLNRKYWAKVERLARFLATRYDKVEVVTGSCGSKGALRNNVNIPKYWFKIIYIPEIRKTLVFLAPNTNKGMKEAKLKKYLTTVDRLERTCHFLLHEGSFFHIPFLQ